MTDSKELDQIIAENEKKVFHCSYYKEKEIKRHEATAPLKPGNIVLHKPSNSTFIVLEQMEDRIKGYCIQGCGFWEPGDVDTWLWGAHISDPSSTYNDCSFLVTYDVDNGPDPRFKY